MLDCARIVLDRDGEDVRRFLTYRDRSIDYQLNKLRQMARYRRGSAAWIQNRMTELQAQRTRCLVDTTLDGDVVTYAGLHAELKQRFGWQLDRPAPPECQALIPYQHQPPTLRDYQEEAAQALLREWHAGIELPTGSGKSYIISTICKRRPVKTVVVTPASAITDQLYKDFVHLFGKKYVGKFGDGSKTSDKLFTVAVAQALVRAKPDSEIWTDFAKAEQLIWDESHSTPAETFESVCLGVLKDVPYRYFVSATQLRTDGGELLLKGITGPIVYRKSFTELVDAGWLAKPRFRIFTVSGQQTSQDPGIETRQNLYLNPAINKAAADIAAKMVNSQNRQTVILIDEFKQFDVLKNYLTVPFEFAHGGASKDAKEFLPQQYWASDVERIVADFNSGKCKCLIGTSAISTGVDIKPVGCLIYLQGGTSEIKVRQALGRGTRIVPGKKDFYVVDFNVDGSQILTRHALARQSIYDTMSDDKKEIRL